VEGLDESIISRKRAYAIIHNPYVKDSDHVVSAIFENGVVAAYTAAFPDLLEGKRIWWFTTLWCDPESRGKGYGLLAIGSLCEEYGTNNVFDLWSAPETVEIFNYLGLENRSIPEYHLREKVIDRHSIKGRIVRAWDKISALSKCKERNLKTVIATDKYKLEYVSFVDDETYSFMKNHSNGNVFRRSHEMVNWILQYPFIQASPLKETVIRKESFSDVSSKYVLTGVRVLHDGNLIGFYILKDSDQGMDIKYLYYDSDRARAVFSSIAEHILRYRPRVFMTRCRPLYEYLNSFSIFPKAEELPVSFSYPPSFVFDHASIVQAGDGDNFV
jgi:hypothetical protein